MLFQVLGIGKKRSENENLIIVENQAKKKYSIYLHSNGTKHGRK